MASNQENNKIILTKMGIKLKPIEIIVVLANNISSKINIKTSTQKQEEFCIKRDYSPKMKKVEGPMSFQERIKIFSGGKKSGESANKSYKKKEVLRSFPSHKNIGHLSSKPDINEDHIKAGQIIARLNNIISKQEEKQDSKTEINKKGKNQKESDKKSNGKNGHGNQLNFLNTLFKKNKNKSKFHENEEKTDNKKNEYIRKVSADEVQNIQIKKNENNEQTEKSDKKKKDKKEENDKEKEKNKEKEKEKDKHKEKEGKGKVKSRVQEILNSINSKLGLNTNETKSETPKQKNIEDKLKEKEEKSQKQTVPTLFRQSVPTFFKLKPQEVLDMPDSTTSMPEIGDSKIRIEEKPKEKEKEYFIDGTTYEQYLATLASENKKEYETGRETFCEGFFIASFPQKDGKVIENSQSFPSPCGHSECSSLPSMKPEIIARYPLKDTKTLELNNLAATICFPTGIKVCYSEEGPTTINDYVTPITNQKGERYYMMTYHFYHKIMNDAYSKLYEMHPLKHHLMKFGDSYLNMSEEEMDEKITNQIQENLEKSQELGFRDYVYVPYCICLISKYRYVSEMKKCLQSIYTMIINHLHTQGPDLNNLIMYIIHSVPIPEVNTKIKFFVPFCKEGIDLICPKVQDINVMNTNITTLLRYFSIEKLLFIFRFILFEKKILFIDDDYTRLSLVTDSFISLLYPFQWVHTYIPIMSDQMLKYLETFLPFLNGINSSLMNRVTQVFINNENDDNEEVFLVYISRDKFRLGSSLTSPNKKKKYKYLQDNVPSLPASLENKLKNKLRKIKDELDSLLKTQKDKKVDLSELDFRMRNVFIEMFVQMFHDYYKYMTFLDDDVVFNKKLFLEKISNHSDKNFYSEFIDTQLFQQFTQNIVKDELKYFTTMAIQYDTNKKDLSKEDLPSKSNKDKLYLIRPDYLQITGENSEEIEKLVDSKYEIQPNEEGDNNLDQPSNRIITELDKIKEEHYQNKNCYIYIIPESLVQKTTKQEEIPETTTTTESDETENKIFKAIQSLKLKSSKAFARKGIGMSEREKDNIKEIIKDFTVKIFKSEEIEDDPNLKKDLQNALNNAFGRDFFVNILSKNVANIVLLREKSFQLLGTLIYNSLLFILNIEETNKLMEQMTILVRSTKYFGQEKKGETTTIWDVYKSRIQGYSKVNQANFWNKWYEIEIKKEIELTDQKKEKIILEICDIMISLELTKSFVKNVTHKLSEKVFGKETEQNKKIVGLITDKIIHTRYISKAH